MRGRFMITRTPLLRLMNAAHPADQCGDFVMHWRIGRAANQD
jgi:hypothetical protein